MSLVFIYINDPKQPMRRCQLHQFTYIQVSIASSSLLRKLSKVVILDIETLTQWLDPNEI